MVVELELDKFHWRNVGQYDTGLLPFTHLLFVEFEDFFAMRVQLLGEIAYELVTFFFRLEKSTFQPPINIPASFIFLTFSGR